MITKPVIKYLGGKTQILNEIYSHFPKTINNYYEPFIGGGSVFLKLLSKLENAEIKLEGKIYLSDTNIQLINLYDTIKNELDQLLDKLFELKKNYNSAETITYKTRTKFKIMTDEQIQMDQKKYKKRKKNTTRKTSIHYIRRDDNINNIIKQGKIALYYYYRYLFNHTTNVIEQSALFIFLNKTCFRGVYRIGPNGFNVPYGNNKNVQVYNPQHLKDLNLLFNKYNLIFESKSFEDIDLDKLQSNDVFYLDPPYYPINKTSFTKYQQKGFGDTSNKKLLKFCETINTKNIKFIHSNSYCEYILKNYSIFNIQPINCKRKIKSKKPNSKQLEVIIYNNV